MRSRSPWLLWAWVFPAAAAVALIIVMDYEAVTGSLPGALPRWLAGWFLHTLTVLAIAAAMALFWWPRRKTREKLFKSLAVLAVVVLALALSAYLPCSNGQTPVLSPITWSLLLFVGEFDSSPFAPGATCAGPTPLALELARFIGIAVTFSAVVLATLTIWRQTLAKELLRLRTNVDVVVGANELAEPLVLALLRQAEPDNSDYPWWRAWAHQRRVVVVDPDPDAPLAHRLEAKGAIFIAADPADDRVMGRILYRRRARAVHRIYFMDGSARTRGAAMAAIRTLSTSRYEQGLPESPNYTLVTVLIEDPREADNWRLEHAREANADARVIVDALCPIELTAELLVEDLFRRQVSDIAVLGDGPLLAALMSELVWQRGRSWVLKQPVPAVRLWSWGASADLADEWQLLAGRLPNAARRQAAFAWTVAEGQEPPARGFPSEFHGDTPTAIIFAASGDPHLREKANRLAKLTPRSLIFVPDEDVNGLRGIFGVQTLYGPATVWNDGPDGDPAQARVPRIKWERLARLQHYAWGSDTLWDRLSVDERWSNTAVMQQFFVGVRSLGCSWVGDGIESDAELTDPELGLLARAEHERWRAARESEKPPWRYGPVRNDEQHIHPELLDWDDPRLDALGTRQKNGQLVRDLQLRARLLGMHAVRTQAGQADEA